MVCSYNNVKYSTKASIVYMYLKIFLIFFKEENGELQQEIW